MAKRGRPRKFDREDVLVAALNTFMSKGYEGTSLDDLTAAMGINRPSLYAAFGNKKKLFLEALQYYSHPGIDILKQTLYQDKALFACFEETLHNFVKNVSSQRNAKNEMEGCLMVNSSVLSCKEEFDSNAYIKSRQQALEDVFYERLLAAQDKGELPAKCSARHLAQYFNCVLQGMAALARGRDDDAILYHIAETALCSLKYHLNQSDS